MGSCEDNCPIVIESNNIPGPDDDACNTSGNGFFCKGSYWIYNPNLPGADTAILGECYRAFLRFGETCVMDEWIEISLGGMRIETTSPLDTDCCPAGTLWKVPLGNDGRLKDEYFISFNDGTTCKWCKIGSFYYSQVNYKLNPGVVAPDATTIVLPLDDIVQDNLNEWSIIGGPTAVFTARNSGTYIIQASIEVIIDKSLGASPGGNLVQVLGSINAAPVFNILLNRSPFEYVTSANTVEISYISDKLTELQAGDVVTFSMRQSGFGGGQVVSSAGRTFINILQTACI